MAFKIFNIGAANKRVEELESESTALKAELASTKENATAVEAAAETIKAELVQAKADLDTAKTTISSLTSRADKAEADLKVANDKIANPTEQVKIMASKEALKITGAQGQPPVTAETKNATQGNGDILAQYAAITDSTERVVFYRKHKAEYDAAFKAKAQQSA